jgi:hypothetical protein
MKVIEIDNAHKGLPEVLWELSCFGVERPSRNGNVLKFKGPCTIVYKNPTERVVSWVARDANPFFHFMESMWMLGGRNDVAFVERYSSNISQFSDDGIVFNAAYGFRWREHFGKDQIEEIIKELRDDPDSRRCLMAMWDGHHDLGLKSKDLPCNTQAVFSVNEDGQLDMSVFNRSNDVIWGALGANAVHFSYLQEFVASCLGREVGEYWQISNNMHLYTDRHSEMSEAIIVESGKPVRSYPGTYHKMVQSGDCNCPKALVETPEKIWLEDLELFLGGPEFYQCAFHNQFFNDVAVPIALAYSKFKDRSRGNLSAHMSAIEEIENCKAPDWKLACQEWLSRRLTAYAEKKDAEIRANKAADNGVDYEL